MHNNIDAYKAAVLRHVTVLIPWHGANDDLLRQTIMSLPEGIKLIVAQNSGKHEMALALNTALNMVKTKYVFCMGSDDVLDRNTLWRLWEAAIDADGSYPWMLGFGVQRFRFQAEPWSWQRIQDANVCGVFLIKTSALRAVDGWSDAVIEDWDLMYRVAKAGYRLNPAPLARYGYRQREDGLHRTTIRQAAEMELTWGDLAPYQERVEIPAVFYEWRLDGTGYVRCELPARNVGGVCRITPDYRDAHQAKTWVFQYPNSDAQEFWDAAAKMGKRRVIDVDDNYLTPDLERIVSAYHIENGRAWGERQESHKQMVREADYVICATPTLAEIYAEENPNVIVCENTVDPADWVRRQKKKRIVGAVLSANHYEHIPLIERAMREASKFKDVEVQLLGLDPNWDFSYTHIGFTPSVAAYRRVLSRWSVGVAPVIDNDLTRGKSDLKWLEFTMSGAALVASDSEAYRRVPNDCLVRVEDPDCFADGVLSLLRDESGRRSMVRRSMRIIEQDRLVTNEGLRSRYNTALA